MADATEQDTVNRCAAIIREFQQLPEKAIPRDVLRHARGLAIISVVKAAFIFCWRVIGRRSDRNPKAIQFPLLRPTC